MNVLHLITGRGPTGPAAAAMSDARALAEAGHKVWLAAPEGSALPESCAEENIPYIRGLKLGRGARRLLYLPRDVSNLRAIIREYGIDVLHVHRSDDQLLAITALHKKLSTTLIRTWHRDPRSVSRLLLGKFARQVDACITVSREHNSILENAGAKACQFIHVAVDTGIFRPAENKISAPSEPKIGQVGRWKRDKGRDRGQLAALEIFSQLSRQVPWKGLLIGRGEMEATLHTEAYEVRRLSRERVEILNVPKQAPQQFAKVLAGLDLGLVFKVGSDGTSRAAAEMLACGVPLIVADVPGLRELAEDNACAVRQLPDDATGWTRAIEKLLAVPSQLLDMTHTARARAESVHSLRVRGEALANCYKI